MLLAITKIILGLQYSQESICILNQTWAEVYLTLVGMKSLVQRNNFKTHGFLFQELVSLTLQTSSKLKKENSKKSFPREMIPHFAMESLSHDSLQHKLKTIRGEETLDHKIILWRLCLQESIPKRYSSSGIEMTNLSPLTYETSK